MKSWWQAVIPHRDIREGRFDEAIFAADLGDVVSGRAPVDYLDSEVFFNKTYLTAGLGNLLKDILMRVSGKSTADSVIQLQTPFGGGKTHTLVALYHLFKNREKIKNLDVVKNLLKECELKEIPKVNIIVFVGIQEDVLAKRTPWGEIAYQLGEYDLIAEHDKKKIAPGKDNLLKVLEKKQPVLILIDECLEYVVKAAAVEVGKTTLKEIFMAFFHELTAAVSTSSSCSMVVTLPSSAMEAYGEAGERFLKELQKIIGRKEKLYTLVEGDEKYEIIRKRLFEDLGDIKEHNLVAQKYTEMYQGLGEDIPSFAKESQYKEKIKKAYPFHPEMIDILFERWGTISTFQRTRGVLRLLALVVSDLYKKQDSSLLIQPSKIDLSNYAIRGEFVKHIGNAYEGVIASDVIGTSSKAQIIDNKMGTEYQRFKVATSLATSIFFYSFCGGTEEERRGIGLPRIKLAFLQEGIPPTFVGDALKRLEDELWYLHCENSLYFFSSQIGLNKVITDREEATKEEDAEEEIYKVLEKVSGKEFDVYLWPKTSLDIPDNLKLKLIILSENYPYKSAQTNEFINELLTKYSTGFRTYKNTLIFLCVDENEFESIKKLFIRLLALRSIKEDRTVIRSLSEENKHTLEDKLKKTESMIPFRLFSAHRHLARGSSEGIRFLDLGIPTVGDIPDISKRVKEFLKEQELLLDKISPSYLLDKTLAEQEQSKSFNEIKESFLKFPNLPMIEDENVIKSAIAKGVNDGVLGTKIGDKVYFRGPIFEEMITEDVSVLKKEIAEQERARQGSIPPEEKPEGQVTGVPILGITKKVRIRARIPWDKLSDIISGVIRPLNNEGAEVQLELEINAESIKGIKKDTLQLKIKETLNQIKAEIIDWEEIQ